MGVSCVRHFFPQLEISARLPGTQRIYIIENISACNMKFVIYWQNLFSSFLLLLVPFFLRVIHN